ncbi:hypothetical protein Anapl_13035, partial [Anas platyrhynchos]
MPAYNQGKWDMALPQVVPFHFYFPVWQKGLVVFCYYMTQSACGYRKQCAEIQLSSSKNNSSSFVSLSASALYSDSLQ